MIQTPAPTITRFLIWIMAITTCLSVANLYYSQPMLADIAQSFHVTIREVGGVAVLAQVGYALGILLFVPLGDMLERRRLIVTLLIAVTLALIGAALAPSIIWLYIASFTIGMTTIVPQVVIPLAAGMTRPEERGKVVGMIMSGLLIGVLLARTVSGFVAAHYGWRTMYGIASGLMAILAIVLRYLLPESHAHTNLTYPKIMQSLWHIARDQPRLRQVAAIGAFVFGAFSAFWTTLVFYLGSSSFHFAHASQVAGLFGLAGIFGASAATLAGRFADQRGPRLVQGICIVILIMSFGVYWAFGGSIWGLIIGITLMDFGTQGAHVSNQATIFSMSSNAHNRLNTIYVVAYFLGGSLGSSLGAYGWSQAHWPGVCIVGLALPILALLVYQFGNRQELS